MFENQKTGGSRELFFPENDLQTSFTVNFPENLPDFGGLETNQKHEIKSWIPFHITFNAWTQYGIKIVLGA